MVAGSFNCIIDAETIIYIEIILKSSMFENFLVRFYLFIYTFSIRDRIASITIGTFFLAEKKSLDEQTHVRNIG